MSYNDIFQVLRPKSQGDKLTPSKKRRAVSSIEGDSRPTKRARTAPVKEAKPEADVGKHIGALIGRKRKGRKVKGKKAQ